MRGIKEVKTAALSVGLLYFLFYAFYAYTLFVGGRLRVLNVAKNDNDRSYTGGQVLTVMGCIVLGSFDLVTVITHIQKIRDGKRAANSIMQVIESKSILDDVE